MSGKIVPGEWSFVVHSGLSVAGAGGGSSLARGGRGSSGPCGSSGAGGFFRGDDSGRTVVGTTLVSGLSDSPRNFQ